MKRKFIIALFTSLFTFSPLFLLPAFAGQLYQVGWTNSDPYGNSTTIAIGEIAELNQQHIQGLANNSNDGYLYQAGWTNSEWYGLMILDLTTTARGEIARLNQQNIQGLTYNSNDGYLYQIDWTNPDQCGLTKLNPTTAVRGEIAELGQGQ